MGGGDGEARGPAEDRRIRADRDDVVRGRIDALDIAAIGQFDARQIIEEAWIVGRSGTVVSCRDGHARQIAGIDFRDRECRGEVELGFTHYEFCGACLEDDFGTDLIEVAHVRDGERAAILNQISVAAGRKVVYAGNELDFEFESPIQAIGHRDRLIPEVPFRTSCITRRHEDSAGYEARGIIGRCIEVDRGGTGATKPKGKFITNSEVSYL